MTNDSVEDMIESLQTCLEERQTSDFLALLDRVLNSSAKSELWDLGERAVAESRKAWESGLFATDELFLVMRHVSNFYANAKNHDAVLGIYLQAADKFAEFNAFQSAYRILQEAEVYAKRHSSVDGVLSVIDRLVEIAITEGDLDFAEKVFRKLKRKRAALKLEMPIILALNFGNLQLRRGNYIGALVTFRPGLNEGQQSHIRLASFLNSSVCLREIGKLAEADDYLDQARSLADDDTEDRVRIEIELVAAKTSAKREDLAGTVDGLVQAVKLIDESINYAGRLHYRRGVRENYRNRISNILASIAREGDGKQILPIIAFLKSNSTSDWLCLLDWYDAVASDVGVPEVLRIRLRSAIDRVARTGAPILYGFREKYDEPWAWPWVVNEENLSSSAPGPALPWAELNNVISDIYGVASVPGVFKDAASFARAEVLASCLEHNQCLFCVTLNETSASVYVIWATRFTRIDIAIQKVFDLYTIFHLTNQGSEPKGDFRAQLQAIETDMSALFAPVLDIVCESEVERMVLLPDAFFLPISAVFVKHEGARKRMLDGKLSVVTCPVPHARNQSYRDISTIIGCIVANDDLKLNVAEVDRIGKVMCSSSLEKVRISKETLWNELLNNDILHIAAHGTPLSLLTDAFFSPTTSTSLDVYGLQRYTWSSTHQLVFLNSCFSADTLNWNYFKPFTTNEQCGLPAVFLLNRRSVVIASQWGTLDVSAYIFADLFYSALQDSGNLEVAFARSTAQLYEMDVTTVRDILDQLSDPETRDVKKARLPRSGYPFRHPYVYGAYQFVSLL